MARREAYMEVTMESHDTSELVRKLFAAYEAGDRRFAEGLLSDDFTFTSPYDDHINRAAFFEKCWPNRDRIKGFRIEQVIASGGDAFVLYECQPTSGDPFRNMEHHVFKDGKLQQVEVFFGDPPGGVARDDYQRFLGVARASWKRSREN
jgi:ketosteroid isomerase-like protein